ncbi:MAG: isochorismatase family protein [Burkholderiaceae bacterium]
MQITRDNALLLVVDIQSRLAPHVVGNETLTRRTEALLAAARLFGVPKLLTEHCPGQIGRVIEPLRSQFGADEIFEKTAFGATGHPEFVERVRRTGRRLVVMSGMEAHVCVLQTALGLRANGFDVCIVADAVGSRTGRLVDREYALQRMAQAGCLLAGTETVLYEWTAVATDARFREVLALVKSL